MSSKKTVLKLILAGLAFLIAGIITGYYLAKVL